MGISNFRLVPRGCGKCKDFSEQPLCFQFVFSENCFDSRFAGVCKCVYTSGMWVYVMCMYVYMCVYLLMCMYIMYIYVCVGMCTCGVCMCTSE